MEPVTIGPCTLYHADCLDTLQTLPDCSVDAVICDPPYAIPTAVAQSRVGVTRTVGDLSFIEAAMRELFGNIQRVLKPTGRMFVFCDGTSYPVVFRAAYGRWSTALLVWDKRQIGMGREFRKSHELILHAWLPETPVVDSNGTGVADVLRFKPVPLVDRVHAAQKPTALIDALLRVCGVVILDPCAGSGSTGVACVKTGRRFIGVEIDPQHFATACRRIRDAVNAERSSLFPAGADL